MLASDSAASQKTESAFSRGSRCPVCEGFPVAVIHEFSSTEAARAFVMEEINIARHAAIKKTIERLWLGQSCRILRCGSCGLCYAEPFVAGDTSFYELNSPNSAYPAWKWEFTRTLQALEIERRANCGGLLEIAAGNGSFLRAAITAGWPASHMLATEFSASGRAAIRQLGVACTQQDMRDLHIKYRFEVICMFQVLEHLDGLDAVFAALADLSDRNADLFIGVPDGSWIEANEEEGLLLDMPPNHVSRWRPSCFEAISDRFGWTLMACEHEPSRPADAALCAFISRYLRRTQIPRSWPNLTVRMAEKCKIRPVSRSIKALGAGLDPPSWKAALTRLLGDAQSSTIWVHLKRN